MQGRYALCSGAGSGAAQALRAGTDPVTAALLLLPAWGVGAAITATASSGFQCHSEHASFRVKDSSCLWKLFEDRECKDWNYTYLWVFFLVMHSISVSDGWIHCVRVPSLSFFCAEAFWSSLTRYSQLIRLSQATKLAPCDAFFNVTVAGLKLTYPVVHLGLDRSLVKYSQRFDTTVQKLWAWKQFIFVQQGAGVGWMNSSHTFMLELESEHHAQLELCLYFEGVCSCKE